MIDKLAQALTLMREAFTDALVDLMLTNVNVTTTVDEPEDSLERDLLARHGYDGAAAAGPRDRCQGTPSAGTPSAGTPSAGTPSAGTPSAGTPSAGTAATVAPDDRSGLRGHDGAAPRDLNPPRVLNPLAGTDDFGQPVPDPNPLVEPSWQHICAMGFKIPGIGWGHLPFAGDIGGDVSATRCATRAGFVHSGLDVSAGVPRRRVHAGQVAVAIFEISIAIDLRDGGRKALIFPGGELFRTRPRNRRSEYSPATRQRPRCRWDQPRADRMPIRCCCLLGTRALPSAASDAPLWPLGGQSRRSG